MKCLDGDGITPEHRVNAIVRQIIDGDTLDVTITRNVRIRVRDCWAPESKATKHPGEKQLGLKAKEYLESIATPDTKCVVQILPDGDDNLGDGLSFGRVVADVFILGVGWLSDAMVAQGLAFRTKKELTEHLDNLKSEAME